MASNSDELFCKDDLLKFRMLRFLFLILMLRIYIRNILLFSNFLNDSICSLDTFFCHPLLCCKPFQVSHTFLIEYSGVETLNENYFKISFKKELLK